MGPLMPHILVDFTTVLAHYLPHILGANILGTTANLVLLPIDLGKLAVDMGKLALTKVNLHNLPA